MFHQTYMEAMEEDDPYIDIQTQEPTQAATQQSTQPDSAADSHLWGYLQPCRDNIARVDFWKQNATISIGRGSENDFLLPSLKISNKHCVLQWDGKEHDTSNVTVTDLSSNGTFINGAKVGKGKTCILREGNEIAFGSWANHSDQDDYRYIFRFTAPGPPRSGLYKYYDIGHELGKGTFATVMRAVSRQTGRWVAVKMIQRSRFKAKGPESEKMFMREISILSELHHPNICDLIETFEDEQSIHIVLEYIDGGDLLDHIVNLGGLAEDHAKDLTRQLCNALAYIHAKGIAHRDLKPENVLIKKGNPPIIKVADFGLAKAVNSMTMFRTTCGTPIYLAPEVILREPEQGYDHLVDSWSVGVIVFSMLSNACPFVEDDDQDIAVRFQKRYIDWDCLLRVEPTPECLDFIERLLEVDPNTRMSLTDALDHKWLRNPYSGGPREPANNASFASDIALDGSMLSTAPLVNSQSLYDPEPVNPAIHEGFERISINEVGKIPGAFPNGGINPDFSFYGRGRTSDKPLNRRALEMEKQDPDGNLLSWELVRPDVEEEQPVPGPSKLQVPSNGGAASRKRKQEYASALHGDSDSSLTPISEDEGQGRVRSGGGGRQQKRGQDVANAAEKRGKQRKTVKGPAKGAKRPKAEDIDMDTPPAPPARVLRNSARRT